jgi:hypothetical protein
MTMLTVSQIRAREAMEAHERAWQELLRPGGLGDAAAASYRGRLRSLPALIRSCGIIHACALLGTDEGPDATVLESLSRWLEHPDCPVVWTSRHRSTAKDRLQIWLQDEPEVRHLWRIEEEALAFAGWLKLRVESDSRWPKGQDGRS